MQAQPDILAILSTFLMHSASRHVSFDITEAQKKLIAHPISKIIILSAMFYIGTRSIRWTIILTILYIIMVRILLNENHSYNIYPRAWLKAEGFINDTPSKLFKSMQMPLVDKYLTNIDKFKAKL
jgi:cell division protein FtsW (lipid II flippase)